MKTTKEIVYEFIQKEIYTNHTYKQGMETKTIADALSMQRSNVSSLLNELVKTGKLLKSTTRPVLYTLPKEKNHLAESASFTNLVGYNGSLKKAIQLAKAAILYPKKSLHVLLSSKNGCGTTYFAFLMYQFAQESGVFPEHAPYVKINCRHYAKNISVLSEELFGMEPEHLNAFARAQGGMLFLDHIDLLDAEQQSRIFDFLETGKLYSKDKSEAYDFQDVVLVLGCSLQNGGQFLRRIPVIIELPELKERPIKEQFELINSFFLVEARNSDCSIEVTAEVIKALLLSEFVYNLKEVELEIKAACANAYVRVVNEQEQDIHVCLNDFKGKIKKSLLKLKDVEPEIIAIIGSGDAFIYDKHTSYQELENIHDSRYMYMEIKKQYDELSNRGINNHSIENVINTHIQILFKKYRYYNVFDDSQDLEELAKIVDQKVIELVRTFFITCSKTFGRNFKKNVFYGLCLHINSLLTLNFANQRVSDEQIMEIIQNYPQEYAASGQFAEVLADVMDLQLPMEEIIIITMFLIESDEKNEEAHPVLLYILHGNDTAASLKDVTNALTHCHNAYSYDLSLGMESKQAMEEIKQLLLKIDNGQGVIVIYDMGSIKMMLDTIAEEIDVKIRYMNIPITLVGIDIARKCSMETDVDYVYHMANLELNKMSRNEEKHNEVILTLCHTGEGGALQLKRYINQYSKLNIKVIALSVSARDELLKEVVDFQKTYRIRCFVGTMDPKLLGIPFVSIGKIFENKREDLDRILMFEPVNTHAFDYDEIYKYLEEQFTYVAIPKLKTILPDIIDEFSLLYAIGEDQQVGLFMHLACLVERLLEGKQPVENSEKSKLISVFKEDYSSISKVLKKLERAFKIIIDDNEVATIIMIVKKI